MTRSKSDLRMYVFNYTVNLPSTIQYLMDRGKTLVAYVLLQVSIPTHMNQFINITT
jgi:hypothetical protein